jgi:formylmethanofuran dehydrogenase subunit E
MNIPEKVEIEFITLECGHSAVADIGVGVCSHCGKLCCRECLQLIDDKLLCPECFEKFIRDKNVEDSR